MAMASPTAQSLSLPLKTRVQLTLLKLVTDAVRRNDGTINRRVMNFLDRRVPPSSAPLRGVRSFDVTVDPSRNLWFRLYIPKNDAVSLPIIFFFHGGGFAFLSAASYAYDAVCRRFSRRLNAVVISIEYRLAPEHKFPAQYDDGFDVVKFIDNNRRSIHQWPEKADLSQCFLAGDSAGGNIAHNLAVRSSKFNFTDLKIIGLINIQPFFGGKERIGSEIRLKRAPIVSMARTDWMWKCFMSDELDLDHWAVNVSGPNALDISGSGFPSTILFIGGFDPLQDWQRRYYEYLKNSGQEVKLVEYPNAIHAFYVFPELPESGKLILEVKEFIEKQSSKVNNLN